MATGEKDRADNLGTSIIVGSVPGPVPRTAETPLHSEIPFPAAVAPIFARGNGNSSYPLNRLNGNSRYHFPGRADAEAVERSVSTLRISQDKTESYKRHQQCSVKGAMLARRLLKTYQ